MSVTLEDRIKVHYEKSITDVSRNAMLAACKILLKGVPVFVKFMALSKQDQEQYFNRPQREDILNKISLDRLDLSHLHAIIRAFGGLTPGPGSLQDLLEKLKEKRNKYEHGKHTLSLDKKQLHNKLNAIEALCNDSLNKLKYQCSTPTEVSLVDTEIANVKAKLLMLKKTADEDTEEKTEDLRLVASQIPPITAILENAALKITPLISDIKDSTTQNTKLTSDLKDVAAQMTPFTAELKKAAADNTQLTTELRGSVKENVKLTTELKSTSRENAQNTTELRNAVGQNTQLTSELRGAVGENTQLTTELGKVTQTLQNVTHQQENLSKTMQQNSDVIQNNTQNLDKRKKIEKILQEKGIEYYEEIGKVPKIILLTKTREHDIRSGDRSSFIDVRKIITKFMLFKNENNEEVDFKEIMNNTEDVIIVVGDGSVGKTVYIKYLGINPDDIIDLTKHGYILHYECKNRQIKSLRNVLEHIFGNVWEDHGMEYDEFERLVLEKNPLFLIDGYDQVGKDNEVRNKLVREIFERKIKCIITTRPYNLRDITYLCENTDRTFSILNLKGIHYKNFLEFSKNYIQTIISDEGDRKVILSQLENDFDHFYKHLGKAMNSPLTLQKIISWKIYHYITCKSLTEIQPKTSLPSTLGKVLGSLFRIKIEMTQTRLANNEYNFEEIEQIMEEFLEMFYKSCHKTYINYEFDLLEETEKGIQKFCKKLLQPRISLVGDLLSIFYTATPYRNKTSYKYQHQIDQEYGSAKYLGALIVNHLNGQDINKEMIKECIILNYLLRESDMQDLKSQRNEVKRFVNVILFLVSEIATLKKEKKLKDLFKGIAMRVIEFAWYAGDSMVANEAEEFSHNADEVMEEDYITSSTESIHYEATDKFPSSQIILPMTNTDDNVVHSVSETSNDSEIESKQIANRKEDKYDNITQCQEDVVLLAMLEADDDFYVNKAVAKVLLFKQNWVITNPVVFSSLLKILEEYIAKVDLPTKIKFSIDNNPDMFEFDALLEKLKEKSIETSLQFNEHYKTNEENVNSDMYIHDGVLLKEFVGKLTSLGIEKLPTTLEVLHLSLATQDICTLNEKIMHLQELRALELKIEVRSVAEIEKIQPLHYDRNLSVIIVVHELDVQYAVKIASKLRPLRTSFFKDLSFQNTSYSYDGIHVLIQELTKANIKMLGNLKVWSSQFLNDEKVLSIKKIADRNGHGFKFYRNNDIEAGLPKLIVKQTQDGSLDITTIEMTTTKHPYAQSVNASSSLVQDELSKGYIVKYPGSTTSPYQCNACNIMFSGLDQLMQHVKSAKHIKKMRDYSDESFDIPGIKVNLLSL